MSEPIRLADHRKRGRSYVSFDRYELRQLLNVYSRRVAAGEWRDYAIDLQMGSAVFSIFRSTFDSPLFSISKHRHGRHCHYMVFEGPEKLKHGKSIDEVLAVFDQKPYLVALSQ
ncbi:MAG: hypothetical protein CMM48_15885 [Rhodospirillaceae bacterium]|nr:hypothetical protein [Rhodospirillaceae bacterium]MBL25364.1 hypothetical protein [Rhodospirillaceae bacterium]HAA92912.1 DUF2794 domain-containing protein [Rhodospirillaceae bacterium]|tara:strand:- start:67 stop:408 length:342 start_codon:yes stop_codon:yes gene_type:complete